MYAKETREGDVYLALLKKLEIEQDALGDKVFDVLGKAIDGVQLRELLIEAIRYGDRPDVKERLTFQKEPDFAVTSVNYNWKELWQQVSKPS